jgi:outer membrane immunogenic protein
MVPEETMMSSFSPLVFMRSDMRYRSWFRVLSTLALLLFLLSPWAFAQEERSEVAIQGTGFYTKQSAGNGIAQHPTDTGGFLFSYRYHFNRWLAAEGSYGFDRNTQQYSFPIGTFGIQSDVHQATGGLVINLPHSTRWRINPYVLAEGGALVFNPTGRTNGFVSGVETQAKGVFVYGGGADFTLSRHFLLRTEYRGLVYKAPDFGLTAFNADVITHTAQPSAGIVFRF